MPLINTKTEIDNAVRGILDEAGLSPKSAKLEDKLSENGLGTDECIQQLGDIARNGDSRDAIRLRAIETGLKLNGVLREADKPAAPTFTIVINDPASSQGVNPILIPRITVSETQVN